MNGPDPRDPHPLAAHRRVGFLKPLVDRPNIEIGEYSYYDDPDGPEHFAERCVHYHFDFIGDRLVIGRFCAIATGVKFIMNGANHAAGGFSTYPFEIFGNGWETAPSGEADYRGDTMVGNDVWIGSNAVILPGVTIGDGAVVGAHSVVSRDVAAYAVIAGNPATMVRMRYPEESIDRLLAIAWWNWPADRITRNLDAIRGADLDRLEASR